MIKAYVNYPNPKVTLHTDSSCSNIQMQNKADQRYIKINAETISKELMNFQNKKYRFAADPEFNDMWLEIDFGSYEFEEAVANYIRLLLGERYSPFARIKLDNHC
jgi:hypothetical protein